MFAGSRALVRLLPGDPIETLAIETGTQIPIEALRAEFGLDRPFLAALSHDLRRAFEGDFGRSLISREPVGPVVAQRFLKTAQLAGSALFLSLLISLFLGLGAAGNQGRLGLACDRACTFLGAASASLPIAWTGPLLMYLLAVQLPLVPISGHWALPTLTLALTFSGLWSRLIRERVRETLESGAAPGARARGLTEWRVTWKYGLIPSVGSLLAYLGTQVGVLLSGAFITETIFDWPGMGALLVNAVLSRDYPVVEAAVFVGATCSLLGTAIGDWAQSWVDPRL